MARELKRTGAAVVSVTAIFLLYAVLLAALMEFAFHLLATHQAQAHHRAVLITFDIGLLLIWSGLLPALALRQTHIRGVLPYLLTGALSGLAAEYFMLFAFHVGGNLAPFQVAFADPGDYAGPHTLGALLGELFRRLPAISRDIATDAPDGVITLAGICAVFGATFWFFAVRERQPTV